MNFYYFNGGDHIANGKIRELEKNGFKGVLFTYESTSRDYFTQIARDIKLDEKIIYMVAIRPYAISPQYLTMISTGMNEIMHNRLQINLISGHVKEAEKDFGGILGNVNDKSSHIERSNYLIDFIKELSQLKTKTEKMYYPDCFITTTNPYVFNVAKSLHQKMIIPFREFKQGHWSEYEDYVSLNKRWLGEKIDFKNTKVMVAISPIIRDTKEELKEISKTSRTNDIAYFTKQGFDHFIRNLKRNKIEDIMLQPWPLEEEKRVMEYVKNYTTRINNGRK